jgi:tetratricopeptide (TPR) repeat protein
VRNNWPPEHLVLHNIEEDGVVLATILKKENHDDYKGYQALTQGKAAEAIDYFKSYLKYDPKNEEVYQYIGDAYAALGDKNAALKAYNQCLELHKGHIAALEKMGRIFMEQKNFANALKVYQRMIKYNEMDVRGYYYGAIAYINQGDAQSAIAYLNKSIEVQPTFKQGYLTLSNIYRQTGQEQLANQFAQKANTLP